VPFEEVMGQANRLLMRAQALAALTARLRLDELEVDGDPAVRAQLDRVVEALGLQEDCAALDTAERSVVVSFARTYLTQALDLVEDPARRGAWTFDDPVLLQAQGAASAVVARLLAENGLVSPGARVLDVGTGVAGLAIALCETFPDTTVVGVDPWEPALALARENVVAAGLEDRVTLQATPVEELDDPDGFDLAWVPSFFIREAALDAAAARVLALLRPGGSIVVGAPFSSEDEPLGTAVDDLFTIRAGGSVVPAGDMIARLERAGFSGAREVERSWDVPLRLVVAQRA